MRYVLLSILVLLATQPSQASVCDMTADQSQPQQSHSQQKHPQQNYLKHISPPKPMSDGDMHAGMAHDTSEDIDGVIDESSDNLKMDCCDVDPGSRQHDCSTMAHCGAASVGLATLDLASISSWRSATSGNMPTQSQVPPNQFSAPPFRPPIA